MSPAPTAVRLAPLRKPARGATRFSSPALDRGRITPRFGRTLCSSLMIGAILNTGLGCKGTGGDSEATASAAISASAAMRHSEEPIPQGKPSKPAGLTGKWRGDYQVAASKLEVEPAAARVKAWSTESTAHVGTGSLELTVDEQGLVSGSATGALGENTLQGGVRDGVIALVLVPASPVSSLGFHGTAVLNKGSTGHSGILRASSDDSLLVRQGTVTLARVE